MKTLLLLVAACGLFMSCKKDSTLSPVLMDPVDSTAQVQRVGFFMNGPYGTTMGVAKIYAGPGGYSLLLDSFSVSSGPDLHVYLSKEVQPVNFIDLGRLRAASGRQEYDITGMPDFTQYKYALVHCQQYNHLFGSANLQ